MSDDGGRQTLVEAERPLATEDVGSHAERVGGARSGAGLTMELEPRLGQVYGEGRRLGHGSGDGSKQDLRSLRLAAGSSRLVGFHEEFQRGKQEAGSWSY